MKSSPKRNHGVALIVALFVVAIVAVSVTQALSVMYLSIARLENYFAHEQAWQYALGAESWARVVLSRDDNKIDALNEDWATALPPLPVERGIVSGEIEDLQARMNVNGMAEERVRNGLNTTRFRCLLERLELDLDLADAIADWIDGDQIPRMPGGVEEDEYMARPLPYRTADQAMVDISELRLVKGVNKEVFAKLSPFVSALPLDAKLNVNTVPKEILVCAAPGLSETAADSLIESRRDQPFKSITELLEDENLKGLDVNGEGLGVASAHFNVRVLVELDRGRVTLSSVIVRQANGRTRVSHRTQMAGGT